MSKSSAEERANTTHFDYPARDRLFANGLDVRSVERLASGTVLVTWSREPTTEQESVATVLIGPFQSAV